MLIIVDNQKLMELNDKERKFIEENSKTAKLIMLSDTNSISLDLMTMMCKYADRFTAMLTGNNDFAIGLQVGMLIGINPKEKVAMLLSKDFKCDIPNVEFGIPEKKERVARKDSAPRTRKKAEGKILDYASAKEDKPAAEEEELPFPEHNSDGNNKLRNIILSTKNKQLREIASEDASYKKLIKAVKDASDPEIGLSTLLDVHFGRDVSKEIIDDVKGFYKKIKDSQET